MKRKKFSNEETMEFARAVKVLARTLNKAPHVIHNRLKQKFKYKSYCWLWKRKKEILEFVKEQTRKAEFNQE